MTKSFIFYEDWLLTAETIPDSSLREEFLHAILSYGLRGETGKISPELSLAMNMVRSQIERDQQKYLETVEKRRAAAKASHVKSACAANAAHNEDGNENANINVNINNSFPVKENEVDGNFSFSDYIATVKGISIPEQISRQHYEMQYVWRMAENFDGYDEAVNDAIASAKTNEEFVQVMQTIDDGFKPKVDFPLFKLAYSLSLMGSNYVSAFANELASSASESGIIETLLGKVEYIKKGNKVNNLPAFLKARKC